MKLTLVVEFDETKLVGFQDNDSIVSDPNKLTGGTAYLELVEGKLRPGQNTYNVDGFRGKILEAKTEPVESQQNSLKDLENTP